MSDKEWLDAAEKARGEGFATQAEVDAIFERAPPAAAPINSLPCPIVLDRTHVNQAFVTLGFDDPATCEAFLKAARILWESPAAAPIDSIRADADRLLAKVKPGELLPQPAPSPADGRAHKRSELISDYEQMSSEPEVVLKWAARAFVYLAMMPPHIVVNPSTGDRDGHIETPPSV